MLEASIIKAVVVQDEKTLKTKLLGVAQYFEDYINFTCEFDWETLDLHVFLSDLREKLAEGFEIPVNRVDLKDRQLLGKMEQYHKLYQEMQQ